jgi:hypothetical protein
MSAMSFAHSRRGYELAQMGRGLKVMVLKDRIMVFFAI